MLEQLNWADYAILAVVCVSALISLIRGFVREALSLLSWVAALFVALAFQAAMADQLIGYVDKPYVREALSYVILFVGTLVVTSLLTNLLTLFVKSTGLDGTDRLLGMVFGAARGMVVVLALVVMAPAVLTGVEQDLWWQESQFIPQFEMMSDWSKQTFTELMQWGRELLDSARSRAGG